MDQRLDAAVRGYEAMIAVGAALDAHHYAHWHPTATAGVFGATAAFGSVIGFAAVRICQRARQCRIGRGRAVAYAA